MGKRKVDADVANEEIEHENAVDEHGQRKSKKKKKQKAHLNGDEQFPVETENTCKAKQDDAYLGMARPDRGDNLMEESKSDKKLKKKRKRKHNHIDNTSENDCDDNKSEGLKSVVSEISNGQVEGMSETVEEGPRKKSKKDKKNKNSDNSLEGLENGGTSIVLVNGDVTEEVSESRKDKKGKKKKKKQKDRIEDHDVEDKEINSKISTPDNAITDSNGDNHREQVIESCSSYVTSPNDTKRSKHKKKAKKSRKQKHEKVPQGEKAEENTERNDTVAEKANDSQKKENSIKGQWKTASFENSDRQDKFIRLLGGYKKGCDKQALTSKFNVKSKENKPKGDKSAREDDQQRPNMAMTSVQEKLYSIALENQYEKAMNFNQKRGMGLGFEKPPDEGKKFYIDVKKAKSIKFDD